MRRGFRVAAAVVLVTGVTLLAGSCGNPLNWALQVWGMIDLVTVKGGTLSLGDVEGWGVYSDEVPVHATSVSTFKLARYEVTQNLYYQVMGNNPSLFQLAYGYDDDWNRPVESVSWQDAIQFCNELSRLAGLTQCYTFDGAFTTVTWDRSANGYRLPTEAEWEYAARGGNNSSGNIFAGSDILNDVAWNSYNEGSITHSVGQKPSNELDLYDMTGNVFEWCWDGYDWTDSFSTFHAGTYYAENTDWNDPPGPWDRIAAINVGYNFVARGGSIYSIEDGSRNAYRGVVSDTFVGDGLGFRVARNK